MFRSQYFNSKGFDPEEVDPVDLECLDTESITTVVGFIRRFQADKSFCPPEVEMTYDSELGSIDIDSDTAPEFGYDFDDLMEDSYELENARAQS